MTCYSTDDEITMNSQQQSATFFDNQLWSITRLAKYLDVPIATIRDWAHKRKIPFLKVGRHIRFKSSDIDTWLKQRSHRCR